MFDLAVPRVQPRGLALTTGHSDDPAQVSLASTYIRHARFPIHRFAAATLTLAVAVVAGATSGRGGRPGDGDVRHEDSGLRLALRRPPPARMPGCGSLRNAACGLF